MTLRECIQNVDVQKPNQYMIGEKVAWLSYVEQIVINNIVKLSKEYEDMEDFEGYTEEDLDTELLVKAPYDALYEAFIKMKIDECNQETNRYNNSASIYNYHMDMFRRYFRRTHLPSQFNHIITIRR